MLNVFHCLPVCYSGERIDPEERKVKESLKKKKKAGKHDIGHVMISYQWADQKIMMTIRDRIREHGYKVGD